MLQELDVRIKYYSGHVHGSPTSNRPARALTLR
jgi:hypothetical protein